MGGIDQVAKQSKQERLAFWRGHKRKWEVSGLTRTAYCQREGLRLSSFDYQRACIRAAEMEEAITKTDTPLTKQEKKRTILVAKATRFVPAMCADGAFMSPVNSMIPSDPEKIHVQSPSGWQVNLTLKQITHDPGAVTSLFQLLQACR
jgi:hypothetical protein